MVRLLDITKGDIYKFTSLDNSFGSKGKVVSLEDIIKINEKLLFKFNARGRTILADSSHYGVYWRLEYYLCQ